MTARVQPRRVLPLVGVVAALSLVLAGTQLVTSPAPTATPSPTGPRLENDELVLATLEPSGLPTEASLVSTVTARGGEHRLVDDPASTVNVAYVSRRGSPETGDGVVRIEVCDSVPT